ncbi:rhodanese-like domain-containing protein [Geodermatophilus sp. SYSU D00708]
MIDDWSTPPAEAAAHFAHRLAVETDVSDVHAAIESGAPGFVLLDSRSREAWEQGHVPGAVHLPGREVVRRAAAELDPSTPVVTYCWGPGCNGATRAALALALLGYRVREMIGGFEYWAREGLPVATATGPSRLAVDPLTAVDPLRAPAGVRCAC